ncbi:GMC family oxidoreductase [Hoeflea sp. TYP-13]|uniref:GMC family oxidoreductase n=1 Tax=Hoeflea sp. TYP-13 TaxID=3230023 RepID=UPI0034C68173
MVMQKHEKTEIVIVGSGIAGSTMAAELAEAGFEVLVLEGGPKRSLEDMVSSQIWSRRLRWGGPPALGEGDLVNGLYFGMGWGTGGAGLHWYGNWYRLHEADFKSHSLYGKGLDWPLDYEDLRHYYDRAQIYFGIAGDLEQDVWSPQADPYPMPPLPISRQARAIMKGFDAAGIPVRPNSVAINSRDYKGRTACLLDGWCDAGCPIGALANPLVLQWPKALGAGAQLVNDAYVTKITTDERGRRATGVEYVDTSGTLHTQPADIVIVAAHTVANNRLLLLSVSSAHVKGLANSSGMLGRHFMSHPSLTVYALFEEETEPYRGIAGGNLFSQEGYDNKIPASGAFGSRTWICGQAAKPNDLLGIAMSRPDLYGQELDAFMRKASRHFGNMVAVCEETPQAENRVILDSSRKDRFGHPVAKVMNTMPVENGHRLELARAEGEKIFKAAGTSDVWSGPLAPMHVIGGTVMGDDPARSVTNSYGQTHDVENLFIAGASLFPTCGAVNPTATLAALVLRTADYIRDNRSALMQ